MGADAPRLHLLLRIERAAARIEHVLEHRRAGAEAWDQPVAAPRIAAILGIVARDSKLDRVAGVALGGAAAGPAVALVLVEAGGEVRAAPIPAGARPGPAAPEGDGAR